MSQSEQRRIAREHRALIKRYFSYTGQARTVDSFQIPYNDSAWCTACKSHKFEKNVFNWARTPDRAYHSVLQLQSEPHFMQFFEQNQCDNAGARCKNLDEYELPTTTKTRCTQRMTNTTVLAIDQTKVYLIDIEVLSGCVCECSGCDRKR